MQPLVIDSSSLITLAGAEALDLLRLSGGIFHTVKEVYRETVEVGAGSGRADVVKIRRLFDVGTLVIRNARRQEKIPGISLADSLLLHLAREERAAALLTNDRGLLRKAEQRGLQGRLSAEFVQDLCEAGKISEIRRNALLAEFVTRGRYTQEFITAFLLGRQ